MISAVVASLQRLPFIETIERADALADLIETGAATVIYDQAGEFFTIADTNTATALPPLPAAMA